MMVINSDILIILYSTNIIDKYLKKNQSIMMAMAKQAMVFHRLESVHIQKHLSKVKITTGFPQEDSFF